MHDFLFEMIKNCDFCMIQFNAKSIKIHPMVFCRILPLKPDIAYSQFKGSRMHKKWTFLIVLLASIPCWPKTGGLK